MLANHTEGDALRGRAIRQLKKRRDFMAHVLTYVLVNTFLVIIWAVSSGGYFWPIFPIAGWGVGLLLNAWDVYHGDEFTEDEIQREMNRMQGAH